MIRPGALLRIAGGVLVALPLVPLLEMFGPVPWASEYVPPGEWILGILVFCTVAGLIVYLAGDRLEPAGRWLSARIDRRPYGVVVGAAAAVFGILLILVSRIAFDGGPVTVDGVVLLWQAKILASGMAVAPAPVEPAFFLITNTGIGEQGWFAQYPPAHPAALAAGVVAGAAWLVPVVLSVSTLLLLAGFARRAWGAVEARWTALLALLCPFALFLGASFLSHATALFCVAAFLYAFVRWESDGSPLAAVAAGVALGAAFLARPWTALAVAVPFAFIGVRSAHREGRWGTALAAVVGAVAVGALIFAWNAATTGDPMLPGYIALWGERHGLGFHATPYGEAHGPVQGLRNGMLGLSLLQSRLFEWPVPSLWPIGILFLAGWGHARWERRLLAAFLALPAAYALYWHQDALLGPRFLYASLAFALPLTARSLVVIGRRIRARSETRFPVRLEILGGTLLFLCLAWTAAYAIPGRFQAYDSSWPSMKVDLAAQARAAGIERGLVFVPVSWGNRLIARMRGAGVPADVAETVYRRADHCDLQTVVDRAETEAWSGARLTEAVAALAATPDSLVAVPLAGDPTLRLSSARIESTGRVALEPECARQVRYDEIGYTIYAPHLLVNRPALDGPLVVARDLREENRVLIARFPDRPAYLWRGTRFVRLGPDGESTYPERDR